MAWDPKIYLDFEDERTRPAAELLMRVPHKSPNRIIDLGCGPGNSTALLARRWSKAHLEGLDSSEAMLDQARRSGINAQWLSGDIPGWSPSKRYDVIFTNATLQWVPEQEKVIPRLMSYLDKGGMLAFQVPCNFNEPSHRLIRDVAAEGPWADKLKSVRNLTLGTQQFYYDILEPVAASIDIWETEYLQVLDGDDPVYRWVSGTGLRPFVQALQGEEQLSFIAEYKKRVATAYPMRASGKTLFPFMRLFAVAKA